MASEIKLPELGENLTGGTVLDIRVKPGDTVRQGQTLVEVEAEKATLEVPSPSAGRITQMLVNKGDSIQVGQTLCLIDGVDGAKQEGPKEAPVREAPEADTEPEPRAATQEPEEPGQPEESRRQVAASLQGDGASKRAAAETLRPRVKEPPGKSEAAGDGRQKAAVLPAGAGEKAVPAGPAARRLARELGVDLRRVQGTALGGRVTQEDIKTYVRELGTGKALRGPGVEVPTLPDFARWGPVERKPLDGVRRKTAEQMSLAWSVVPHVTQQDQADITDLEAFRRQQEGGPKLTVTAFALKAAAITLRQFPQFNSSIDLAAGQLVLKRYCHIGVAVDTDRGLLVPVLRDVDRKSIHELAQELAAVAERARQKKIPLEEMRGGTFTITNLGGIGGTGFSPIVNYPEVAILGLSRSRLQPVVRDGQIVPRLLLPLSVSYDHRAIDGADAARFTRRLAELLENPMIMLLHA
jgi:pyruvate dehydrogenase E2 component (dihydrolipoamide acetyltransferase)